MPYIRGMVVQFPTCQKAWISEPGSRKKMGNSFFSFPFFPSDRLFMQSMDRLPPLFLNLPPDPGKTLFFQFKVSLRMCLLFFTGKSNQMLDPY